MAQHIIARYLFCSFHFRELYHIALFREGEAVKALVGSMHTLNQSIIVNKYRHLEAFLAILSRCVNCYEKLEEQVEKVMSESVFHS